MIMAEHRLAEILRFSCLMIEHLGQRATMVAQNQIILSDDDAITDVWRAILADICLLLD